MDPAVPDRTERLITSEPSRPRSALQLLRDRTFGPYFAGNMASNVGTWCHDIAAVVFIFQLTGLSSMVALVSVAGFGVSIVLAPVGGHLADRFDRRLLLLVTSSVLAVVTTTLAVLVFAGLGSIPVVLAATFLLGIGRAVNTPTLQAFLPSLIPPADLAQASALQSLTFNLARGVGPAVGAGLIALGGPGLAFAANAVSFVLFALILAFLHVTSAPRAPMRAPFLDGVRYVGRAPSVLMLLLLGALVGMATDPPITLGPSLADAMDLDASFSGIVVTAFGLGSLVMAPFVGRLRVRLGPGWTCVSGLTLIVFGFAAVGLVQHPVVSLIAAGVAGAGYLAASSDVTTSLLELLDDSVRGRVMALWTVGFLGGRPIAALLDGGIADATSPHVAIGVMAGILALGGGAFALWLGRSNDGLTSVAVR